MDQETKEMFQALMVSLEKLSAENANLKQDIKDVKTDLQQDIESVKSDLQQDINVLKQEVTKINIKIENSLEPDIKLIAEGQQPLAQIAKDVEHIKEEQEEIKNNVAALMKIVPEHGAKIEELKKRA